MVRVPLLKRCFMRVTPVLGAAVVWLAGVAAVEAASIQSGVPVGGRIGPYKATKCGGGNDGVELGKTLCFT